MGGFFQFRRKWFADGNWTATAELPPDVVYHMNNQPHEFYVFQIIAGVFAGICMILAIIQAVRFRQVGHRVRALRGSVFLPVRTELLLSMAIFPACICFCQLLGLIFVRQARLVLLLADFFTAVILSRFWSFIVGLFGGAEKVTHLAAQKKPYKVFSAAPLCCCGALLPKRKFAAKDLRWSRLAVWQFTLLVPIASLVRAFNNGVVNIEQILNYCTAISMFICMWGLHVLTRAVAPRLKNTVGIRVVVESTVIGVRILIVVVGIPGIIKGRNKVYNQNVMVMAVTNFCVAVLTFFTAILSFFIFSAHKLHSEEIEVLEMLQRSIASSHNPMNATSSDLSASSSNASIQVLTRITQAQQYLNAKGRLVAPPDAKQRPATTDCRSTTTGGISISNDNTTGSAFPIIEPRAATGIAVLSGKGSTGGIIKDSSPNQLDAAGFCSVSLHDSRGQHVKELLAAIDPKLRLAAAGSGGATDMMIAAATPIPQAFQSSTGGGDLFNYDDIDPLEVARICAELRGRTALDNGDVTGCISIDKKGEAKKKGAFMSTPVASATRWLEEGTADFGGAVNSDFPAYPQPISAEPPSSTVTRLGNDTYARTGTSSGKAVNFFRTLKKQLLERRLSTALEARNGGESCGTPSAGGNRGAGGGESIAIVAVSDNRRRFQQDAGGRDSEGLGTSAIRATRDSAVVDAGGRSQSNKEPFEVVLSDGERNSQSLSASGWNRKSTSLHTGGTHTTGTPDLEMGMPANTTSSVMCHELELALMQVGSSQGGSMEAGGVNTGRYNVCSRGSSGGEERKEGGGRRSASTRQFHAIRRHHHRDPLVIVGGGGGGVPSSSLHQGADDDDLHGPPSSDAQRPRDARHPRLGSDKHTGDNKLKGGMRQVSNPTSGDDGVVTNGDAARAIDVGGSIPPLVKGNVGGSIPLGNELKKNSREEGERRRANTTQLQGSRDGNERHSAHFDFTGHARKDEEHGVKGGSQTHRPLSLHSREREDEKLQGDGGRCRRHQYAPVEGARQHYHYEAHHLRRSGIAQRHRHRQFVEQMVRSQNIGVVHPQQHQLPSSNPPEESSRGTMPKSSSTTTTTRDATSDGLSMTYPNNNSYRQSEVVPESEWRGKGRGGYSRGAGKGGGSFGAKGGPANCWGGPQSEQGLPPWMMMPPRDADALRPRDGQVVARDGDESNDLLKDTSPVGRVRKWVNTRIGHTANNRAGANQDVHTGGNNRDGVRSGGGLPSGGSRNRATIFPTAKRPSSGARQRELIVDERRLPGGVQRPSTADARMVLRGGGGGAAGAENSTRTGAEASISGKFRKHQFPAESGDHLDFAGGNEADRTSSGISPLSNQNSGEFLMAGRPMSPMQASSTVAPVGESPAVGSVVKREPPVIVALYNGDGKGSA